MNVRQFFRRTHLHRAILLWIVLAVAVCIKIGWRGTERSVYPVFAAASHHWWADQSLYVDYWATEGIDGYRYSPAFAIAFSPFAMLPDKVGAILWSLLSIGLLLWALHRLACEVLPHDAPAASGATPGSSLPSPPWEAVFLTLTLFGSMIGIWSGQTNAIIPALIALGLVAIQQNRWWAAATFLAIPVFIKIWPMAIVLLLMVFWPRQLIGRFLFVCLALTLLPFLTRPPSIVIWQYQEWYRSLTGPLQDRWHGYRDAWTVWEQVARWLGYSANWSSPVSRRLYSLVQLATGLGVLGWCLWQRKRMHATGQLLTAMFAIWAAWQLLFGPGTEQLTYGIIAPAAGWAVLTSFGEKAARWLTILAWSTLAFLPSGDMELAVRQVFPAAPMLLPLGVGLFLVWLVWHESGPAQTASVAAEEPAA